MLRKLLATGVLCLALTAPLAAAEPEIVIEWNNLPYAVIEDATGSAWNNSKTFGKALIQRTKVDCQGDIYVTALSRDRVMKFDQSTGQVSRLAHHPEMNWPALWPGGQTARSMWSPTTCMFGSMAT